MKIDTLTPAQESALPGHIQKWIDWASQPTDRHAATDAVKRIYAAMGEDEPTVLCFASPMMASMAAAVMRTDDNSQLYSQLRSQLDSQLRSQLDSQLYSQLRSQLDSQLYSQLDSQLRSQLKKINNDWYLSVWWGGWAGWYEFARMVGVKFDEDKYHLFVNYVTNVQFILPYKGIAYIADAPVSISWDADNRLHAEDRMAVEYADGYGLWCWRGVRVPEKVITGPENLTYEDIAGEDNAEVRMAIYDRLGGERFGELLDLVELDCHRYDSLYYDADSDQVEERPAEYRLLETAEVDEVAGEKLKFLHCVCPSTGKVYHQGVPPDTPDALSGAAWLAGLSAAEYQPGTFIES